LHALQANHFFRALKGHGALCRLVILPFEIYAPREGIMHVLWEIDRWLQKYCVSNSTDVKADIDASKHDARKEATGSESNKRIKFTHKHTSKFCS
jgi:hypothetical protein